MSSLEDQAKSRKERLAQLRGLKRKNEDSVIEESQPEQKNEDEKNGISKVFKPRNFDVESRETKVGFEDAPDDNVETVEVVANEVKIEALANLTKKTTEQLDLSNLKPKSVTWDLERDLEPKLRTLEARTDNAIIKIVRERLRKQREDGEGGKEEAVIPS